MVLPRLAALAAVITVAMITNSTALAASETGTSDSLSGVSCPSRAMCMAVGLVVSHGVVRPLSEQWNGKRWRRLATPAPAGSHVRSYLGSVSCTGTSRCLAVGDMYSPGIRTTGIVERWDGVRWRLLHLRIPRGAVFSGVSCTARGCIVVGVTGTVERPLALRLAGNREAPLKPRLPGGTFGGGLIGVSCTSASWCMAVGWAGVKAVGVFGMAEFWDGAKWHVTGVPHPRNLDTVLSAVSCAKRSLCLAAGAPVAGIRVGAALTVLWRAERWRRLSITGHQIGGLPDVPDAVSCPSVSRCVATEYGLNNGGSAALIWNGGSTLRVHPVLGPLPGKLFSISCPGPRDCIAVGGGAVDSAVTHDGALSELLNGSTWKLVPVTD